VASLNDGLGASAVNSSAEQLFVWGVLYGLLSAVFDPITTTITQDVWESATGDDLHRALSAELLAVMVVRGWMDEETAYVEASKSGISSTDFANMVSNGRNPISPEEAAVALRRQIIPQTAPAAEPSFDNAIKQGNLGDQWGEVIQRLATAIPSPADVLQGVLTGQVPAGVDPVALYTQVGGEAVDPNTGFDWYTFMFNTRGSAPTPNEASVMANRRIIPWGDGSDGPVIEGPGAISFQQAFLEGPWRNKWETAWRQLAVYVPPPRTVTTLLRAGAITTAQAIAWFEAAGMDAATADAYIASASSTKTTTAKQLNEGAVETLYLDKLIDEPTAASYLELLGYTASEANLLLQSAGLRQEMANLNRNTGRIGTYYISKKIDDATARSLLAQLGLPGAQIDQLMEGWAIDRAANLKLLTPAQIATAYKYDILSQDQALASLEADGYTPFDAWVLLSNGVHAPIPGQPAPGPPPIR
jgi:hypothetical protein